MMMPICRICLRCDIPLQTLNDHLDDFYDELCEFNGDNFVQFCAQCLCKLIKCYHFKRRCQYALNVLKSWKKKHKSTRKSIKELHNEIPNPELNLCNTNNFKVYFYTAPEASDALNPVKISTFKNIVTLNIPDTLCTDNIVNYNMVTDNLSTDNMVTENIVTENIVTENIVTDNIVTDNSFCNNLVNIIDETNHEIKIEPIKEEIYFVENDAEFVDTNEFKMGDIQMDIEKLDDNLCDNDNYEDAMEDSDSSVEEFLSQIKERNESKRKVNANKIRDIEHVREELRVLLRKKFETYGAVEGDDGSVIELDVVLRSLDRSSAKIVKFTKRICSGPGPFKPLAIRKLTELQARFSKYESVFTTVYVSEESQVREEFERRREYVEYTNTEYRCEKCIRGFKFKKALDHHIRTFHEESAGQYSCKYCQMRCKTSRALKKHTALHSLVHKCKLCLFVTSHRSSMKRHFEWHNDTKYQCKYCDRQFRAESVLYAHYNNKHASRYFCVFCARVFNKEKGLIVHRNLKHRGEEFVPSEHNRKCDECDVTFANDDVYNRHLEITHQDKDASENCDVFKKRRRKYTDLKISCRLCQSEGNSPGWLVGHFLMEHPNEDMKAVYSTTKNYLCHDCGKQFPDITTYNDHTNLHTGAKPYPCPKCPKRFHRRTNLRAHFERHLPPTKECKHCGKMFATASYLASHMRIHINDRRYKCEICGKGFLYPATLKEHINGVHFNIRRKKKSAVE